MRVERPIGPLYVGAVRNSLRLVDVEHIEDDQSCQPRYDRDEDEDLDEGEAAPVDRHGQSCLIPPSACFVHGVRHARHCH